MVKDDLPAAQGWQCIDALCCPGDLCDLYIAAEVSPPVFPTPRVQWYPTCQMTPHGPETRSSLCACVWKSLGEDLSGSRSSDMPVRSLTSMCDQICVCVCVWGCVCTWQEREREELGWAALSCLSERSLRHCRTALYRTGLWSARGKLILERPREVERDWVSLEMLHRSEEDVQKLAQEGRWKCEVQQLLWFATTLCYRNSLCDSSVPLWWLLFCFISMHLPPNESFMEIFWLWLTSLYPCIACSLSTSTLFIF